MLPERTAWAARRRGGWQLVGQAGLPQSLATQLCFAISRELLDPAVLAQHFCLQGQEVRWLRSRPETCAISRPKQRRLTIGAVGAHREAPGITEHQRQLQQFRVSPWLHRGRLWFRKDRWAYAPRQFGRTDRAHAQTVW